MVFEAPVLLTYTKQGQDYVDRWNANVSTLQDALIAIESTLNSIGAAQGTLVQSDWYRRRSGSSPLGGAVGNSLRFQDDGSNIVSLQTNVDGLNIANIGADRRYATSPLSTDLSDLALADGDHTIYLGVDASGDTSITISASAAESDVGIVLYELEVTVSGSGSTYTVNRYRRTDETLLWDNTVEQSRQEVPIIISYMQESLATGENIRVYVPVAASITRMSVNMIDDLGVVDMSVKDTGDTTTYLSMLIGSGAAAGSVTTASVASAYSRVKFAAGTILLIKATSIGTTGRAFITLELRPEY